MRMILARALHVHGSSRRIPVKRCRPPWRQVGPYCWTKAPQTFISSDSAEEEEDRSFQPTSRDRLILRPQRHCYRTLHLLSPPRSAQLQQTRSIVTWLPEAIQNVSIWGGSGYLLKTIHHDGLIPYWACFASINIGVRLALLPLVLYGAQTSARFAKVVPELQFMLSLFQRDLKKLREVQAPWIQRAMLYRTNLSSFGAIYKIHKIHPFAVFLSPLVQFPIFWYMAVDLRKIVNGLDPLLAQELVDSSFAWVPDLTEPDPWFGLPILCGIMLYWNMEVAIGKRSLAGPATEKSDTGALLKDVFQSFAVFMPCVTSQLPGGVQVYLLTSFGFTLIQSAALRTESVRQLVGLPSMHAPPPEPEFGKRWMELHELEKKAREIRGDGPLLGTGVLAVGFTASFPGEYQPSTIQGSGATGSHSTAPLPLETLPKVVNPSQQQSLPRADLAPQPEFPGVSAPLWQLQEQQQRQQAELTSSSSTRSDTDRREYMPQISDEVMEKANKGELPLQTRIIEKDNAPKASVKLDTKRLNKRKKSGSKKKKPRRR